MKCPWKLWKYAAFSLLIGCCLSATTAWASPGESRAPKIVNIMPAFWAFETQAKDVKSASARDKLFRKLVIAPYPNIYGKHEFQKDLTNKEIERYLEKIQPHLSRLRQLSSRVQSQVRHALARFVRTFPAFDGSNVTIAFMPSLLQFVGQSTKLKNGDTAILFGLDRMAASRYGKNLDLAVITIHELFHVYHRQVNPAVFNNDKLYATLWIEGLATYASQRLNPDASKLEILGEPQLVAMNSDGVRDAARRFLAKSASTSPDARNEFFYSRYKGNLGNMPPLTGYLLGYRVCKLLGQKHSLKELARLNGDKLKAAIRNDLKHLAEAKPPAQ